MNLIIFQVEHIKDALTIESVSVIGLLIVFCGLLIWDRNKKEAAYNNLRDKLDDEQADNKKILIELVSKSILATEQNTTAINTLRDVYNQRK